MLGNLTDEFDMSYIVLNQTTGDDFKLKFYNTEVDNVDFTNTVLVNSDFENATLNNVNMTDTILNNSSFKNVASMTNIKFHGADLTEVDFTDVDLTGIEFTNLPHPGPWNEDYPENYYITSNYANDIATTDKLTQTVNGNERDFDVVKNFDASEGNIIEVKKSTGTNNAPVNGDFLINQNNAKKLLSPASNNLTLATTDTVTVSTNGVDAVHAVTKAYNGATDSSVEVNATSSNNNVQAVTGVYYKNKNANQSLLTTPYASNLVAGNNPDVLTDPNNTSVSFTLSSAYTANTDSTIRVNNGGNTPAQTTYKVNYDGNKTLLNTTYANTIANNTNLHKVGALDISFVSLKQYNNGDGSIEVRSKNANSLIDPSLANGSSFLINRNEAKTLLTASGNPTLGVGKILTKSTSLDVSYNVLVAFNGTGKIQVQSKNAANIITPSTGTFEIDRDNTKSSLSLSAAVGKTLATSDKLKTGGTEYSVAIAVTNDKRDICSCCSRCKRCPKWYKCNICFK